MVDASRRRIDLRPIDQKPGATPDAEARLHLSRVARQTFTAITLARSHDKRRRRLVPENLLNHRKVDAAGQRRAFLVGERVRNHQR